MAENGAQVREACVWRRHEQELDSHFRLRNDVQRIADHELGESRRHSPFD
jgi:hypothetical protein